MIIRIACVALVAVVLGNGTRAASASATPEALWAASASQALDRQFPDESVSYLLLDARTGSRIAARWPDSATPIPMGSLVKPFTAVAYAESHGYKFPRRRCHGADSCWFAHGHGELGIIRAVALSCNAYFTQLASDVPARQVAQVAGRFGLKGPSANASPAMLAGRYGEWRESPESIASAYIELLGRRAQPGIDQIVQGMSESARRGTAVAITRAVPQLHAYAKTGTAACTHHPHAPGDGFAVVAWPAESPQYLLFTRVHGRPGAESAAVAGEMVRILESRP